MKGKQIGKLLLIVLFIAATVLYTFVGFGSGENGVKPLADDLKLGLDIKGGVYVVFTAETAATGEEKRLLLEQTVQILDRRINSMGLTEPNIYLEGDDRIRVELPGVENSTDALKAIGKTAKLVFAKVKSGEVVMQNEPYSSEKMEPLFGGEGIKDAVSIQTSSGFGYGVSLSLNDEAADAFAKATAEVINYPNPFKPNDNGGQIAIILDGVVISAPRVNDVITNGKAEITGDFNIDEARELATLIKSGALPVTLIEERSSVKGPTLGQGAYEMSVKAAIIGIILVMLFMIIFYKLPGMMASIALTLYSAIIVILMVLMDATLTLPGVLGIVLSIGMAVDANVIIFEKFREELDEGKSLKASVSHGFSKALRAIVDSNVTTLIAAIVLFYFGEGPIKGFAVTLMLGIITSMFTAIFITRTLLVQFSSSKKFSNKSLYTSRFAFKKHIDFIGKKKLWFSISAIVIVAGLGGMMFGGLNYGIDFTGGTMMQIDLGQKVETSEIQELVSPYGDFSINFEGDNLEQVVLMTKSALKTDKRSEIFDVLKEKYQLKDNALLMTEEFGPKVGSEIQGKAWKAIILAAIGMLIYIAIRFEITYAVAAILALLHDILILLALYAVFKVPVSSAFIAAILTVVGYSINDTIVIFDRIREEARYSTASNSSKIANVSLNSTLTRSMNTSFTTLIVIASLMVFSISSIRELALPLLVGVLTGTYSSIFIASPIWVAFKNKLVKGKKRTV